MYNLIWQSLTCRPGKVRVPHWREEPNPTRPTATEEFTRRFLPHVLPDVFHRFRHYGLFANGGRAETIARARQLLNVPATRSGAASEIDGADDGEPQTLAYPCPCCGGRMIVIQTFERG